MAKKLNFYRWPIPQSTPRKLATNKLFWFISSRILNINFVPRVHDRVIFPRFFMIFESMEYEMCRRARWRLAGRPEVILPGQSFSEHLWLTMTSCHHHSNRQRQIEIDSTTSSRKKYRRPVPYIQSHLQYAKIFGVRCDAVRPNWRLPVEYSPIGPTCYT